MYEIIRYDPSAAALWNDFVAHSKNGTFLLDRRYMDYHADRFDDASLMVYDKGRLMALLPGHRRGSTFCSHDGLTYGGLVVDEKATAQRLCDMMAQLNDWWRGHGFRKVVYKPIPWIYHRYCAEEDLYAIVQVCGAQLTARDVAAVVCMDHPLAWRAIRQHGEKVARKAGCMIHESENFADFWKILTHNLMTKYGVNPVHTLDEILLLHQRFPQQIRLVVAEIDGAMMGGAVLYVTPQVVHVQYISASPEGKKCHVLDLLFRQVMQHEVGHARYFDFGKSTEGDSCWLNGALAYQKEGFGARSICYDTYHWTL